MKRFRVLETHRVEVWTYVWAKDKEEAQKKLEDDKGETEWDDPEDTELQDSNIDSLEEIDDECKHPFSISHGRCWRCGETVEEAGT